MNRLIAIHRDRRRAQRGSVLSGVLIITAFIAILSGALMTALSDNFLLSSDLMKRTIDQATLRSAVELGIDNVQNARMSSACPSIRPAPSLNGTSAMVSYLSCALVTDSTPPALAIADTTPVTVDGSYFTFPGLLPGRAAEYLVTNANGTLFAYPFGSASAAWTYPVGGNPTAPPLAMSVGGGQLADLIPINRSSGGPGVAVLAENPPGSPALTCIVNTNDAVTSAAAAGRNAPSLAYFGDRGGTLYAYDASAPGSCGELNSTDAGQAIVAGPVAFPGTTSRNDRLFVLTAGGGSNSLVEFRYSSTTESFTNLATLSLPAGNPIGLDVDSTSLPARMAIDYSGGQLALVQISSSFTMTLAGTASVPGGGLSKPPSWCTSCLGGTEGVGVAGPGGVFVYDANLTLQASFTGVSMSSSPAADSGGDWFVGGSDGSLYELHGSGTMVVASAYSVVSGSISSSPIVNQCNEGLCAYFGASPNVYLIPYDQNDVTISTCISAAGSCSTGHARLWAHLVIGAAGNPRAVRVLGFTYYSP